MVLQTSPGGPLRKNQEITCRIDTLGAQGEGICREMGQILFIPYALPGETVRAQVQKVTKSLAFGRLLDVLSPSPDRVAPPCSYFGRCGGCSLQHLDYQGQLVHKSKQIQEAMQRVGKIKMPVPPAVGLDEPWRYRNKTALPVQEIGGQPYAGYYAPRSHRLVPITSCLIAHPACDDATRAVTGWMREQGIAAFNEEENSGLIRHLVTRVNALDEVMVILAINGKHLPNAPELIKSLQNALPRFHSLHLTFQTTGDNVILGETSQSLYGDKSFVDWACGLSFELSPLSFFQVNSKVSQRMYERALLWADLQPDDTAVDLYSGAGAITLLAAGQCKRPIGFEISIESVENARSNALRNHADNAFFHLGEAEILLPQMLEAGLAADVVFLDPPRKGAHSDVLKAIAKAQPRRIIYISCHPASQARDAALLGALGYHAALCQPYDMFCQTAQVENVMSFERIHSS